jgi:putative ABC transport system permease protein
MRELSRSSRQAIVFCLCVALSLTSLTVFSGFSESVSRTLLIDAKKLHAADIIVHSHDKFSDELDSAISEQIRQGKLARCRYWEFYSMVRRADDQASVLSLLKVVEKGYPFYGEIVLKSGRLFHDVLTPGQAVVEQSLLDRLGAGIGDSLKVGYTTLTIRDVVVSEPDRPANVFSFGPRVFVSSRDLDALNLIRTGSRITYVSLLKVADDRQTDAIAGLLRQAASPDRERVDTYRTARTRVKRFLDNFIFFLKLVGIFILIIAGMGIQNTLTAFFNEKERTIAIMKTIGATHRQIIRHFMPVVVLPALLGTVLGISTGIILQQGLARLLSAFFPPDMPFAVAWIGIFESMALGIALVSLFTFMPLFRLRETRPVVIFRHRTGPPERRRTSGQVRKETAAAHKRWPEFVSVIGFGLFFFGLVFRHMQDLRFGFYFVAGLGALILFTSIVAQLLLWMLKRLRIRRMVVRQAIKGLFRQGGATRSVIVTLTASLSVIFSIYLLERNLDTTYVKSFPADAPNLFMIDIQPGQQEAFANFIARPMIFYPIVRARITAINDKTIDRRAERARHRDNLGRTFNLTYRHSLLADEKIIKGGRLFRDDWTGPQVSVLDTVVDMHQMDIGDTIQFNIQGVPLKARISSIRTRTADTFGPYFYFVFEEKTLKSAPRTIFTALRVEEHRVGPLQSRIAKMFPNISVIDLSATIRVFSRLMKQLSTIIKGFCILSMAAGFLILISGVFATRAERITESVYYKILGAGKTFVGKVFSLEIFIVGLLSGILALIMSQTGVFLICRFFLDIAYHPFLLSCSIIIGAVLLLIIGVGMVSTTSILEKKPVIYLREQPDE